MLASCAKCSKGAIRIFKRTVSSSCLSSSPPLNPDALRNELTARVLPLAYDYLTPQPSHLLNLSLLDLLSPGQPLNNGQRRLPSIKQPGLMPAGHHLVYFPPQVTVSELLPDGTDILHTPGQPFNRRLWAGGEISFPQTDNGNLLLHGQRAACVEKIEQVDFKGPEGDEKILVTIDRRFTSVGECEDETQTRAKIATNATDVLVEKRTLVFMRDLNLEKMARTAQDKIRNRRIRPPINPDIEYKLTPNKALLFRFSALTFNAHLIHLDPLYAQKLEGHHDLLVHGPLTLVLMLSALSNHLSHQGLCITNFEYRNLVPLYVDEELRICATEKHNTKSSNKEGIWEVWIEGPQGGLAVRGTARTAPK